jgi:hypothetical protein
MHLIPIDHLNDMDFKNPKLKLSTEAFRDIQERIIKNLKIP